MLVVLDVFCCFIVNFDYYVQVVRFIDMIGVIGVYGVVCGFGWFDDFGYFYLLLLILCNLCLCFCLVVVVVQGLWILLVCINY